MAKTGGGASEKVKRGREKGFEKANDAFARDRSANDSPRFARGVIVGLGADYRGPAVTLGRSAIRV